MCALQPVPSRTSTVAAYIFYTDRSRLKNGGSGAVFTRTAKLDNPCAGEITPAKRNRAARMHATMAQYAPTLLAH